MRGSPTAGIDVLSAYKQELIVNWGESDPFGLVYYAREVAWFNEIEHELFRQIGHPDQQDDQRRTERLRDGQDQVSIRRPGIVR